MAALNDLSDAEFDPVAGVEVAGGDLLRLRFDSGAQAVLRCTVPVDGVLRLSAHPLPSHLADSPVLVEVPDRPATVSATASHVRIQGPGVDARWPLDGAGMRLDTPRQDAAASPRGGRGAFRMFPHSKASKVPFPSAGRLLDDHGRAAGWLVTSWLTPDAAVYGGGESSQGPNLRGRKRRIHNREMNRASGSADAYLDVPLFWSDAGWGGFAHTGAAVLADLGSLHSECAAFAVQDPALDLFLLLGDPPDLLGRYLRLTGLPRPLPDWAFGVWLSRCSYFSAKEAAHHVAEVRAAGCPVDVVHVDDWLQGNVLADATWSSGADRDRFPQGWAARLAEDGLRVSLWINPFVRKGSELAEELQRRELLATDQAGTPAATTDKPDQLVVDFTNPQAQAWWRDRIRTTLREEGVAAMVADFGESVPDDACFSDGQRGHQLHNTYALLYQRLTFEAATDERSGDYVQWGRAGTAGAQRYACHWVGDVPSTWAGMTTALRMCLSLALSGFAVVGHDVGGFWTPASYEVAKDIFDRRDAAAFTADVEPELFARWAQFAALSPIMRFHGVGRREPTAYPEPARSAAIRACQLRARLRPELLRAAHAAWTGGVPMLRPMVLAFPGDRGGRDADLQYLLGDDILVAPVLETGGRRELWVPPGRWTPLAGLRPVEGPGWTAVECAIDQFPAWRRAEA